MNSKDSKFLISCGDQLYDWDQYLISSSKLTQLAVGDVIKLPKTYLRRVSGRAIESIEEFAEFLDFAVEYEMDIQYICGRMEYINWYYNLREQVRDVWTTNAGILQNIEQHAFNQSKFTDKNIDADVNGANNGPIGAYPQAAVNTPKFVNLRELPSAGFKLDKLVRVLIAAGATDFVTRLLVVLGCSIEHYESVMTADVLSQCGVISQVLPSVLFYAFRVMFLEELTMYRRKRSEGRFIMDLTAVQELPVVRTNFLENPYVCTLVKNATFNNGLTLPATMSGDRGVYRLDEFKQRLDIFSGGVFDLLEWQGQATNGKYKTALTGSVMTACLAKTPLESRCGSERGYFDEYYPGRRLRVVSKFEDREKSAKASKSFLTLDSEDEIGDNDSEDGADEKLSAKKLRKIASQNNKADVTDDTTDDTTDARSKRRRRSALQAVDENTAEKSKSESSSEADDASEADDSKIVHNIDFTDMDLMLECEWKDFDEVAKKHYEAIRRAVDLGRVVLVGELTIEKILTENKHKYIVKGLKREIDIFHVNDIPSVIVKYHLGCVRCWYDGSNVWCFPTFVAAAMTGINVDIRWTSNRKDVRDIVLKYFQRGFGTLLTPRDKNNIAAFINAGKRWGKIGPSGNHWRAYRYWRNLMFHDRTSSIFNPSMSRLGIHFDIYTPQTSIGIPATHARHQQPGYLKASAKKREHGFRSPGGGVKLPMANPDLASYF